MPNRVSQQVEKDIVSLYNNGYGTMKLADKFSLNRSTIQRILIRNNVSLRKTSPWKNQYNIHFFDTYNIKSCYWAGFIAADGCIRSDRNVIEIKLNLTDFTHLEKFAKSINYVGDIKKNNKYCYIDISGEWFVKKLKENFNIIPQKTYILKQPPKSMPDELFQHYIRGYFDGDGCITYSNNNLHINFTSGSENFLYFLQNYFFIRGIKIRKSKNNITEKPIIYNFQINYFCKNAYKILSMLYINSTNETRLDRKYNLYLQETLKYN